MTTPEERLEEIKHKLTAHGPKTVCCKDHLGNVDPECNCDDEEESAPLPTPTTPSDLVPVPSRSPWANKYKP